MAKGHLGLCLGSLPVPVGSNPAGERLYLQTSKKWGRILFGLSPPNEQSFKGLIDHLILAFQSCETVSSLTADFYNQSQKTRETEDVFVDELQVLVWKIVACKPEFINKPNQALKHQFAQNLRDPYFGVIARGQCFSSLTLRVLLNFRLGWAWCSMVGPVSATSTAVDSGDAKDHLSHNSRKKQSKIDAQAAKITTVKAELNMALQENKKLKNLFSTEKLVEAMTKVVSAMTMQDSPKHLRAHNTKGPQII